MPSSSSPPPPTRGLHRRAKRLFAAALRMPAAEREARLREACWGDLSLLEEVTSLLRHHDDGPLLREGAERRLELLVAASRAALLGLLSSTRQEASGDD